MSLVVLTGGILFPLILGCASIIKGSTQEVNVNSNPEGVNIFVQGDHVGTTPAAIKLKRKDENTLRFEKEGYEPIEVTLKRNMNGWLWGNLLFGGLIGIAIDFGTGAAYRLEPKEVNIVLEQMGQHGMNIEKTDEPVLVVVEMSALKK